MDGHVIEPVNPDPTSIENMKLSILEFQADIRVMKADVVALEAALLNRHCPQGFEQDKFDYFKTLTLDEKKNMIKKASIGSRKWRLANRQATPSWIRTSSPRQRKCPSTS
jgi:hypothetical protein